MHFAEWLLKRIWGRVSNTWSWIEEYRKLILEIPFLAILVTVLVGTVWFIIMVLVVTYFNGEVVPPKYVLYCLLCTPVIFFIYNWLAAMRVIYNEELQQTYDTLKG